MKKRKVIIYILTIINICIIIVMILNILKNQMFQRKYIKELFEKNEDCKNYIVTINYINYNNERNNYQKKIVCKDNIYKEEKQDGIVWYVDDKRIIEANKEIINFHTNFHKELIYESNMFMYIDNTDINYRFVKMENYNGKKCLVIEFYNKAKYRYWVEESTGFILKEEIYDSNSKIIEQYTYDIEINCVKDEDLILPNTDSYTITEIEGR